MGLNEEILSAKEQIQSLGSRQKKEKAELLFVLAVLYVGNGQKGLARAAIMKCITLLNTLSTDTLGDCAATTVNIGSVFLPELFHQGTVRERMKHLGINL